MSLINDALKRAKAAQQQCPPGGPSGPPLRPVEPRPARNHSFWLLLLFAIVVAGASILLWQWFQQGRPAPVASGLTPASTQTPPSPTAPPRPASPSSPESATAAVPSSTTSGATATPAPTESKLVTAPSSTVASALPASESVLPATNGQAVTSVATSAPPPETAPKATPLELQGILHHPTRPSAVINGKLLFVGERVAEWRVLAIEPETVTLTGGGRTNVLTLR